MPTGYTAAVEDGSVTELKDFALRCAREFGALVSMREEPIGTPIPDEFKPDGYYTERLVLLRDELSRLELLTVSECIAAQNSEIAKARAFRDEYVAKRACETQRYLLMLEKVKVWQEPSADHAELKSFMVSQLESSIDASDYEPSIPLVRNPEVWLEGKVATIKNDIDIAQKYLDADIERCQKRTLWVRLLKGSL